MRLSTALTLNGGESSEAHWPFFLREMRIPKGEKGEYQTTLDGDGSCNVGLCSIDELIWSAWDFSYSSSNCPELLWDNEISLRVDGSFCPITVWNSGRFHVSSKSFLLKADSSQGRPWPRFLKSVRIRLDSKVGYGYEQFRILMRRDYGPNCRSGRLGDSSLVLFEIVRPLAGGSDAMWRDNAPAVVLSARYNLYPVDLTPQRVDHGSEPVRLRMGEGGLQEWNFSSSSVIEEFALLTPLAKQVFNRPANVLDLEKIAGLSLLTDQPDTLLQLLL